MTPVAVPVVPVNVVTKAAPKVEPEAIAPVVAPTKTKAAPKVAPVKAIAPIPSLTPSTEKSPSAIAPSNAPPHRKDYLKDIGFTQKKVFSSHKTEAPTTPEDSVVAAPEAKVTETAPVLTDLSATTSTPIKVLTKSSK